MLDIRQGKGRVHFMKLDKAAQKRFRLVCPKELYSAYVWWRVYLIGYHHHRGACPPRFPKTVRSIWRAHARNLISIYAPRRKLACGHMGRDDHCLKCIDEITKDFEKKKETYERQRKN